MPKLVKLIDEPKQRPLPDGRGPRLLDEKLIRDFCKLISRGLPVDAACDYYSIPQTTFSLWHRNGKAQLNGDGEPEHHRLDSVFVQAMMRAMAEYRKRRLQYLHDPDSDPKARMIEFRILER